MLQSQLNEVLVWTERREALEQSTEMKLTHTGLVRDVGERNIFPKMEGDVVLRPLDGFEMQFLQPSVRFLVDHSHIKDHPEDFVNKLGEKQVRSERRAGRSRLMEKLHVEIVERWGYGKHGYREWCTGSPRGQKILPPVRSQSFIEDGWLYANDRALIAHLSSVRHNMFITTILKENHLAVNVMRFSASVSSKSAAACKDYV